MTLGNWKQHKVKLLNGSDPCIEIDAKHQIISEKWGRVAVMPSLTFMPDKSRLLMAVNADYGPHLKPVHYATVTVSDDLGATWSKLRPVKADASGGPDPSLEFLFGATYLGDGKVFTYSSGHAIISNDHGETWEEPVPTPEEFAAYFPMLAESGRILNPVQFETPASKMRHGELPQSGLWISNDNAASWESPLVIPEWFRYEEPHIARAANGDLVAALRTSVSSDPALEDRRTRYDNYHGLGVSISTDDGFTWSKVKPIFDWGRHHASIVTMPTGEMVMTYGVRMGYPATAEGFGQWGIEAIVSRDNGRNWDLDHRFVLAQWHGCSTKPNSAFQNCQNTSSVVLPDGNILTVFGTGFRAHLDQSLMPERPGGLPTPRDIGAVLWKPDMAGINDENSITAASPSSDVRNKVDIGNSPATWAGAALPGRKNIALKAAGAVVTTSECYDDPEHFLYDPWCIYCPRLETIPAWVEIEWPQEHVIDCIVLHPGSPEMAKTTPESECIPRDYRLQYEKSGEWLDLIEPVKDAPMFYEYPGFQYRGAYHLQNQNYVFTHDFPAVSTSKVRLLVTKSSDTGVRKFSGGRAVVPPEKRKTIVRRIDIFEK